MSLTTDDKSILQDFGVPDLLAANVLWFEQQSERFHLESKCQKGTIPGNVLNFSHYTLCSDCASSTGKGDVRNRVMFLGSLASALRVLLAAEAVAALPDDDDFTTEHLGTPLKSIKNLLTLWPGYLDEDPELNSLSSIVAGRARDAEAKIVSFLRSDVGRVKTLETYVHHTMPWGFKENALLLIGHDIRDAHIPAFMLYGVELTSDVYLLRAPDDVLAMFVRHYPSTPLMVDEDVSADVLHAAASLWEPNASTVLGYGPAVLDAAKILVNT